jgi:uncharacterized membrane protein (DUF485 family)
MYNQERERRFQFEIAKAQVDFEINITVIIGVIAILYGLLSFYGTGTVGYWLGIGSISVAVVLLGMLYRIKERTFEKIRKKYVESYWD